MTHVLVTRPLESSQQLAEQLDALDYSPIVMPLYTFSARRPPLELNSAWSLRHSRCLAIFTSPRAVHFGLVHILDDRLKGLEIAAVGAATRAKLEARGCEVHLQASTGYSSEDLLQMPELAANPGEAVIFCAPGGRETLANGLKDLGWNVLNALVYERVPMLPDAAQIEAVANADELLSIWTSVSALELARQHLPAEVWEKILNAPALVISERIRHHLQQLGAARVEQADGPGNTELLQSILRLRGR